MSDRFSNGVFRRRLTEAQKESERRSDERERVELAFFAGVAVGMSVGAIAVGIILALAAK